MPTLSLETLDSQNFVYFIKITEFTMAFYDNPTHMERKNML